MTRAKKQGGAQRELQVEVESDFSRMLGPLLERLKAEVKAEMEHERGPQRPYVAPDPVEEAPPEKAPRGPARGPNSRYAEPGIRLRRGQIKPEDAGATKIWSGFMDPEIISAFREEAKRAGMTQRYACEEAWVDWIKKKSGGKRVLRPMR